MICGFVGSSIGLDRLATQGEVRCAMLFSSPRALEFVGLQDDFSEMGFDLSGRVPSLREEIGWLTIVREMQDCIGN
jgi:hypothetical protein